MGVRGVVGVRGVKGLGMCLGVAMWGVRSGGYVVEAWGSIAVILHSRCT